MYETATNRSRSRSLLRKALRWTGLLLVAALLVLALVVMIPLEPTVPSIEPRPSTDYWEMSAGYRIAFTRETPDAGEATSRTSGRS